ncbi:MAG: methyltransferase domain-containing protein, partial [Pseudomonadales bacterium]|nr:class I SAM-dependent methyltransferase [Pseudomonadales bacterium]NIX07972.1 methyltransferase domain-containing protein [Pseudomonadales bacterium]
AQAGERLDGLPNVKLRQRDFTELPAIRRYRAVIAAMVVHHLASPQRFFRHAARILRHGGLLIV